MDDLERPQGAVEEPLSDPLVDGPISRGVGIAILQLSRSVR
jgi:hypothetical protein